LPATTIVEALAQRRRAGEPFEQAWPAVVDRLPSRERALLTTETFEAAFRDAYERRPPQPRHAFALTDVREDAHEHGRTAVLG
jgi:hypothetical protein